MSELKKKQHYVWRYYLRAWAEKEQIWSLLKGQNKIIRSNLMGVAQERYFYELVSFTDKEEAFLEKLVRQMSHPSVVDLNMDFFVLFTSHYKLKHQLESITITEKDRLFLENEIRVLKANMMEDTHGKMETSGMELLSVIENKNYHFLENQEDFYETMMFLCFQYFRTKKMKNGVEKSFQNQPSFSKFWNVISHVLATTLARNLSFSPDLSFTFFENKLSRTFLTCDQPIFNTLSDSTDEDGNTNAIELYYPLGPKLALLISFESKPQHWIVQQDIDENMLDHFNRMVIEFGDEFIFATNKQDLEFYNS